MTHAAEAGPNPWAGEVVYWHPEHAEIRCLSLHGDIPAVGRGVAGGTIRFEGEITVATIGLDQPRGPRKLGQRQIFAGPDEYREVLLEDSGSGFQQLAAWDFVRVPARSAADVRAAEKTRPALPEAWRAFEPLVNTAWEAHVDAPTVMPARVRSRFEWNADLETLCVQITRHMAAGLPSESIDAYVYRDVATPALRCLALSDLRGVHEGSATVLDDGAIELELKGYDGERVVSRVVRLEIEPGAQLRARCWTVAGSVRTLALDVRHEPLKPN
jgi:hypothetical protein